jgi:hypothetical protein
MPRIPCWHCMPGFDVLGLCPCRGFSKQLSAVFSVLKGKIEKTKKKNEVTVTHAGLLSTCTQHSSPQSSQDTNCSFVQNQTSDHHGHSHAEFSHLIIHSIPSCRPASHTLQSACRRMTRRPKLISTIPLGVLAMYPSPRSRKTATMGKGME